MKLAIINDGKLELRWMWLPTFIAQNYGLMRELAQAWEKTYPQGVPKEEAETKAHYFVLDWLQDKLKIDGLRAYLGAIELVKEG